MTIDNKMTTDHKFTAFTCHATAQALGLVPLPPPERILRRPTSGSPTAAILGRTAARAGRQRLRSRKGCRWLAEAGNGFETAAPTDPAAVKP